MKVSRGLDESLLRRGVFADRVLDLAQAIVLVLDAEGRIAFFNRYMEELSGYELAEVQGRDWFSTFIRREDRREIRGVFRTTKQGAHTTGARNLILTKSGEERVVEWRNCALEGRDGRLLGVLAVGQDVTHQREIEDLQQIRRDEALLRSVTASVPGAVFQLVRRADGELDLLFLSDGARELFGVDPRRPLARADLLRDSINPEERDEFFERLEESAREGVAFRFEYRLAGGGQAKWALAVAEPESRADGSTIWNGVVTDITPEREAQEARRLAEARWRALLESAPDAMVLVGEDGIIQLVNAQAERLFGYRRDELVGQGVETLVPERLRARHEIHRTAFLNQPRARAMGGRLELVGRHEDGREFPIEVSLSPIPTPEGIIVSAAIRDASERRRSELRLRRAHAAAERASASKSRFLATASHDLRQPLQAANLYVNVLAAELGGQQPRSLEKLRTCLDALGTLLGKLFDISRLESGRVTASKETIELGPLLTRLADEARPFAEAKGLELRLVRSSALVFTDPQLLEQILQNLLSNAVRYTDSGRILVGCRRHGSRMRIQVWDTGRGIAEDDLERVFEEFFRVESAGGSSDGLGLGLAIVSRVARLLDHPVAVVSRSGEGSRFEISVPLCTDLRRELTAEEPAGATRCGVLVVLDTDPHVLDAMRLSLQLAGHEVVAGGTAESVVARLHEEGLAPDIVLADLHLGGDGSGIEAVRRIRREFGSEISGVLLTGDTSRDQRTRAAAEGFEILHKPVAPQELEDFLERCLAARGTGHAV